MRFTIWRNGVIVGTYAGANEQEALEAAAKDEKFAGFADANQQLGLSRDDYKVKQVE